MEKMLTLIRTLPSQIEEALKTELPKIPDNIKRVFFSGMGGSAIAGDIVRSLLLDSGVEVDVIRDYTLPPYVDRDSLLIAISYSGNTEETISVFEEAIKRKIPSVSISSGGKLKEISQDAGVPHIEVKGGLPPRTALGYLFTYSLRLLAPLEGVSTLIEYVRGLPEFLLSLQKELEDEESEARELADRFYLRIPVIYSSSRLFPVAFRWKTQINENAKAFVHVAVFPEMNHNEISGIKNPEEKVEMLWLVFLRDEEDHPRIKLRMKLTADILRDSVMGLTFVDSKGRNPIERIFHLIYLGDYVSYYLSKYYNEDPIAIPRIDILKERLKK